jgi:hypothetical protein
MSDAFREAIAGGQATSSLCQRALRDGMRLLRDDGPRLVSEGVTTVDDALRVAEASFARLWFDTAVRCVAYDRPRPARPASAGNTRGCKHRKRRVQTPSQRS